MTEKNEIMSIIHFFCSIYLEDFRDGLVGKTCKWILLFELIKVSGNFAQWRVSFVLNFAIGFLIFETVLFGQAGNTALCQKKISQK